jgi:hypothetical protein
MPAMESVRPKSLACRILALAGAGLALACGNVPATHDGTGPSCPAYSYIVGDACAPFPAFAGATIPSSDDASALDGGVAQPMEAGLPDAAIAPCAQEGAPLVAPEAGSIGPWITGTEVSVLGLARDPEGNVFAIGSSPTESFFLAKFDSAGVPLWTQTLGGTEDVFPQGVAADVAGSVVVVGTTSKSDVTVDFGGGPLPAGGFVVKYDREGRLLFQKMFPMADDGSSFPWMNGVRVLASGDIAVAGSLQGTIDFGGGPLTAAGGISVFLARFAPCGGYVFARQYGVTPNDWSWSYGLATNGADELLVTGIFEGTVAFGDGGIEAPSNNYDSFVATFDALGDPIAGRSFHSADPSGAPGMPALDDAGRAIVVGRFTQPIDLGGGVVTPAGSSDAYVAAYGPHLEYLWALPFGDAAFQSLSAATIDGAGNVVVAGTLSGGASLGTTTLQAPDGGSSALVARLAPDGGVLSAALAAGESSGAALVAADGTDVLLGGAIDVGPFRLGGEALDAGARGVIMKFAP